jgi:hypothetical protein
MASEGNKMEEESFVFNEISGVEILVRLFKLKAKSNNRLVTT